MKASKFKVSLLLFPQLLISIFLMTGVIYGLIQGLGYIPALSMTDWTLDYYIQSIQDPNTLRSILFSLWIAFASSVLSVLIGLFICYLFINQKHYPKWVQALIQIPIIVPHIIVALFVIQILSQTGILARLLYVIGFENAQQIVSGWLFDPQGKGVILAYLWKEIPFIVFFCFNLIRQINGSLGEAAQTLGANRLQAYVHVTLPLCRQTILTSFFIIFMFTFGAYELPAILGPTLPQSIAEATYIAYTHPDLKQRPFAMAMNGWIFIISLGMALLFAFFIYRKKPSHKQGGQDV